MNQTPSTLVTPHTLFVAAAIAGAEANPSRLHDVEKEASHALRIAAAVEQREWGR